MISFVFGVIIGFMTGFFLFGVVTNGSTRDE